MNHNLAAVQARAVLLVASGELDLAEQDLAGLLALDEGTAGALSTWLREVADRRGLREPAGIKRVIASTLREMTLRDALVPGWATE